MDTPAACLGLCFFTGLFFSADILLENLALHANIFALVPWLIGFHIEAKYGQWVQGVNLTVSTKCL